MTQTTPGKTSNSKTPTPLKTAGETAATECERLHTPSVPDYAGYVEPNHFKDKRFTTVTFFKATPEPDYHSQSSKP